MLASKKLHGLLTRNDPPTALLVWIAGPGRDMMIHMATKKHCCKVVRKTTFVGGLHGPKPLVSLWQQVLHSGLHGASSMEHSGEDGAKRRATKLAWKHLLPSRHLHGSIYGLYVPYKPRVAQNE